MNRRTAHSFTGNAAEGAIARDHRMVLEEESSQTNTAADSPTMVTT